jgi:hypothetical protein
MLSILYMDVRREVRCVRPYTGLGRLGRVCCTQASLTQPPEFDVASTIGCIRLRLVGESGVRYRPVREGYEVLASPFGYVRLRLVREPGVRYPGLMHERLHERLYERRLSLMYPLTQSTRPYTGLGRLSRAWGTQASLHERLHERLCMSDCMSDCAGATA